jgi:rhodanese-related sulfurtransferase
MPAAIDKLLATARARIAPRVEPDELGNLENVVLVDIRPSEQRTRDGTLPGAFVIDRNVLEWRLDPTCAYRIPDARPGCRIVLVCNEGYQSSLAASTLRDLGIDATDIVGGFNALRSLLNGAGHR